MAFKVHAMPGQAADTGRYVQARAGQIDNPHLGESASRLGAGIQRLMLEDPEDVHLLVGAGLTELQDLRAEEQRLAGEQINRSLNGEVLEDVDQNKANARLQQVRARMDGIRARYTAMGRTQRGRNEVSRALTSYMTQVSGAMTLDNIDKRNAQFTKSSQVQLNQLIRSAADVTSFEQVNDLSNKVISLVADPEADRFAMSGLERKALRDEYRGRVLDAVMGAYVKRGDYASAKAMEDEIAKAFPDLMGPSGGAVSRDGKKVSTEGDASGETSSLGARGVLYHNMVDSLRQRDSAQTLVAKMASGEFGEGFGSIHGITSSLYARKGKAYKELVARGERDGVGYDALMAAAYQAQGMKLELQRRDADRWFAPVQGVRDRQFEMGIPQQVGWENQVKGVVLPSPVTGAVFSTPKAYWEHLVKLSNQGNAAAAMAAQKVWELWHQPERMGDGNGSGGFDPEQNERWMKVFRQKDEDHSPIDDAFISHVYDGIARGLYPRSAGKALEDMIKSSNSWRSEGYKVTRDTSMAQLDMNLQAQFRGMSVDQLKGVFGTDLPDDGDYTKTKWFKDVSREIDNAHRVNGRMDAPTQSAMVMKKVDDLVIRYNASLESSPLAEFVGLKAPAQPLSPSSSLERTLGMLDPRLYYREAEDGTMKLRSNEAVRNEFFARRNDPQSPLSLKDIETVQAIRDSLGNAGTEWQGFMSMYEDMVYSRSRARNSAASARDRLYPATSKDQVTGRLHVEQGETEPMSSRVQDVLGKELRTRDALIVTAESTLRTMSEYARRAAKAITTNPRPPGPAWMSPAQGYSILEGLKANLANLDNIGTRMLARCRTEEEREKVRAEIARTRKDLEDSIRSFEEAE